MATPVVTVASGGMPVVDVTATKPGLGMAVTEALNGRGMPVTKVAGGGVPVTFSTVADYPPSGGGGPSAEAAAWLARAPGLDATHIAADTAFINGMVDDGLWSKFDVLVITATQNSAAALLNMISSSYAATIVGAPVFTADRGFTGVGNSTTIRLDSNFNPRTAPTPKYGLNGAHVSIWGATDTGVSPQNSIGGFDGANTLACIPRFSDGLAYFGANTNVYQTVASASPQGHFISNRDSATTHQGYKNKVSIVSGTNNASANVPNFNVPVLANYNGGSTLGSNLQASMYSFGGPLTIAEIVKFFDRARTRMTAVGVP
jgi:hypothetical protein